MGFSNLIIDYIDNHKKEQKTMVNCLKQLKQNLKTQGQKREEISKSATRGLSYKNINVKINLLINT